MGVGGAGLYYTIKICEKHYRLFREINIIKELILCFLHYVKLIILCFCFCNICFWYYTLCNAINIAYLIISFLPLATLTCFP